MILHFLFTDVGRPLVEGLQRGSWLSLTQCICEMGAGAGSGNPNVDFYQKAGQLSEPLQVLR